MQNRRLSPNNGSFFFLNKFTRRCILAPNRIFLITTSPHFKIIFNLLWCSINIILNDALHKICIDIQFSILRKHSPFSRKLTVRIMYLQISGITPALILFSVLMYKKYNDMVFILPKLCTLNLKYFTKLSVFVLFWLLLIFSNI